MKKLKPLSQNFLVKLFTVFILLTITCCERSFQDETTLPDANIETVEWMDLLQQLNLESDIIIVESDASIQDAIDAAAPGDAICIEPGLYLEAISIDKPDIRIIGLESKADGSVILENPTGNVRSINQTGTPIEIFNIQLRNFIQNDLEISSLKSTSQLKCGRRFNVERYDLGNGIAHYEIDVPMGKGEFDLVRIHRVVRECRPYRPVRTQGDLFMIHGAIQNFEDIFLNVGAEEINAETSSPYYLAANDIDVWGIDMGWTRVPMETSDFSFMKDWGVERDVCHTRKAMSIARLIRGKTRQGYCPMNLLGFSYGVHVAYGTASKETQMHCRCRRNVKGLIPVDSPFKYAPEDDDLRDLDCIAALDQKTMLDGGLYHSDWGVGFIYMGNLALAAPDKPSPIPPFDGFGLTNSQALMAAATDHSGGWHFFGGTPFEFYYSDPLRFTRMAVEVSPYMPFQMFYELSACGCDKEEFDVSFDDHLEEISVPILYLGGGGGSGTVGHYSSSLTASTDITNYTISIPGTVPETDYGHADLWFGYDADVLVWDVLRQWLVDHSRK